MSIDSVPLVLFLITSLMNFLDWSLCRVRNKTARFWSDAKNRWLRAIYFAGWIAVGIPASLIIYDKSWSWLIPWMTFGCFSFCNICSIIARYCKERPEAR